MSNGFKRITCSATDSTFDELDIWGIAELVAAQGRHPPDGWMSVDGVAPHVLANPRVREHLSATIRTMASQESFVHRCLSVARCFAKMPLWSKECRATVAWYSIHVMLVQNHGFSVAPAWIFCLDLDIVDWLFDPGALAVIQAYFTEPVAV